MDDPDLERDNPLVSDLREVLKWMEEDDDGEG